MHPLKALCNMLDSLCRHPRLPRAWLIHKKQLLATGGSISATHAQQLARVAGQAATAARTLMQTGEFVIPPHAGETAAHLLVLINKRLVLMIAVEGAIDDEIR